MTRPIYEPSLPRTDASQGYGIDQLFRRPAPLERVCAVLFIKVFGDFQTVTTGDKKFQFEVSEDMDDMFLVRAESYVTTVSSSGIPTVQIRNVTQTVDMLTTKLTIDASKLNSKTAATPVVIDVANDDVAWGDHIAIDVDVAGTGAKGLGVMLTFCLAGSIVASS